MRGCVSIFLLFAWVQTAQAQEFMVPHLTAPGGGFSTSVSIFNHTDEEITWRLLPHASDGTALSPVSGTLPARGSMRSTATALLPEGTSHFFVEDRSSQVSVNVAYQNAAGRGSPAHVAATAQRFRAVRFLSGNWNAVFDGFAVVNTGTESTDVEVVHFGFNGQELNRVTAVENLEPNAKGLYVVGAPNGSSFDMADESYFEVRAAQDLAIVALRGTPPGSEIGYLWENPVLSNTHFHDIDLMMTHLTRPGGGFSSQILIQNQTSESQSFDVVLYAQDGTELADFTRTVSRNQTHSFSPADLFGQVGSEVSHFKIERTSRALHLVVSYTPDGSGSPAHVGATSKIGTSWSLSPGNWDEVFDGFAVVNLGQTEADVYVQQLSGGDLSESDAIVACERILTGLAPNAKGLFVLGGPGTASLFDIDPDTHFRIFSPLPLALMPLRGSVPGSSLNVLWPNQAFRLVHLDVSQNPFCDPEEDGFYFSASPYVSHTRRVADEELKDGISITLDTKFVEIRSNMEREIGIDWSITADGQTLTDTIVLQPRVSTRLPIRIMPTQSETLTIIAALERQSASRVISSPSVLAAGNGAQRLWNFLSHPDRRFLNRAVPLLGQTPLIGQVVTWQRPEFRVVPGPRQETDTYGCELLFFLAPRILQGDEEKRDGPVLETLLPCGESQYGLVLCPQTPVGDESDAFFFVYESVRAPIPLNDPDHFYQYGIVFDSDGSPANNWVPHPDFPGDVYQGTDQWYSAEYAPQSGWRLVVSEIVNGNIVPMASDARMVIADDSLVLIVPKSEFESDNPGYRVTSYEHMGDYGNSNPWSGDVHPPVDEPLATLD